MDGISSLDARGNHCGRWSLFLPSPRSDWGRRYEAIDDTIEQDLVIDNNHHFGVMFNLATCFECTEEADPS